MDEALGSEVVGEKESKTIHRSGRARGDRLTDSRGTDPEQVFVSLPLTPFLSVFSLSSRVPYSSFFYNFTAYPIKRDFKYIK